MTEPLNHLVIDLEATCSDRKREPHVVPREEMEIIEIGAVMVAADTLEPVGEFQSFVRPIRHPVLTDFCRELTSITQAEVDAADRLPAVLERLVAWAEPFAPYRFGSWGDYDRSQFRRDCDLHGIAYPFADHVNLKAEFSRTLGVRRRFGMRAALDVAGLELTGTHHRGIDDARNLTRLLPYVFGVQSVDPDRIPGRRRRGDDR